MSDNSIVVADSNNHRIQIFDDKGHFVRSFDGNGHDAGELYFPADVVIDEQGRIFVADDGHDRVQVFDDAGRLQLTFSSGDCEALTIDRSGNIYVVDADSNMVRVFDADGVFQYDFGNSHDAFRGTYGVGRGIWNSLFGSGSGFLNRPRGVAVDDQGSIIVADYSRNGLRVYRPISMDRDTLAE